MQLNVIITGTTGMVGEGVLHESLNDPSVASVLVINRRPCEISHPKLKEILHKDFFDLSPIEDQLKGYNACFFCLGVTSVGKKADEYYKYTYTLTMHVAETLSRQNIGMTFCYVSGAGTYTTENGPLNWARVKGKTENDLGKLPFKAVYNFRPGLIKPIKGLKRTHPLYPVIAWLFPVFKLFGATPCKLEEIAHAMRNVSLNGYEKKVLEVNDIIKLGN